MAEDNPIIKVYDALWTLIENNAELATLVSAGNRIKHNSDGCRNPEKDTLSTCDFPEIRIVTTGTAAHLQNTSSSSNINKRFRVEVSTGERSLEEIFELEWNVYIALLDWQTILTDLTWNSKKFVKLARPLTVSNTLTASGSSRGIVGWMGVFEVEVDMWFTTLDMKV